LDLKEFVIDEQQLVDRARNGDCDAYGELIRRFQHDVRAFIKSRILNESTADDLAQEVFVGGYKSIRKFQGKSSLKSWLISIAKFKIIDYLKAESRKKQLQSKLQLIFEQTEHQRLTDPADSEFTDVVESLRKCIEALNPNAKKIVSEYYFENRSAVDIGDQSGLKPGTVRMNLMRIRQSLAKCIRVRTGRSLGK